MLWAKWFFGWINTYIYKVYISVYTYCAVLLLFVVDDYWYIVTGYFRRKFKSNKVILLRFPFLLQNVKKDFISMPIRVGFETTIYTKYYIAKILKCVYTACFFTSNKIWQWNYISLNTIKLWFLSDI